MIYMKKIEAAYKRYNANSRNTSTSDCVKRSLSMAYGMDYDKVGQELNQIKNDLRLDRWNIAPVYDKFIKRHGLIRSGSPMSAGIETEEEKGTLTVSGFCDMFPQGTYILLVGDKYNRANHMVCIIDGDFWDSWDCSSKIVSKIYEISTGSTDIHDVTVDDIQEELLNHVKLCIEKSNKKMPWATFKFGDPDRLDKRTLKQWVHCMIDEEQTQLGYAKYYSPCYTYTIKINPRLSKEENIKSLKDKLWVKIREWAYAVRKEVEDDMNVKTISTHPNFRGDKELLLKVPDWARPLITYAKDHGSSDYTDRYVLDMDALPDDYRAESVPSVTFYADTIPQLRRNFEDYKKNFNRFGYDY